MTQEEIYIKLIQGEKVAPEEISKEFLRDFQFCKIALEKIGIYKFSKEEQREMNLQAVEIHLHSSESIFLQYDIPEIVRLVPENISGNLELWDSQIKELPQLKSVGWNLYLSNSLIWELPQLKSVGRNLNLKYSQIKELPQLKSVGRNLNLGDSEIMELPQLKSVEWGLFLQNSQIREFPQLERVGVEIFVSRKNLQYWKGYFAQTNRSHLVEKVFTI